ncbi:unnamed protein product [marine sediment metagenome]|uniref:Uncharacterized protein n=1 Tax=marine sediment metagenome TaxID=412755 RepID=X1GJ82_9ZZZZ
MSKELDPVMAEAMLASLAQINITELMKVLDSKLRFNVTFEGTPLVIDVRLKPNEILVRIKVVENGD